MKSLSRALAAVACAVGLLGTMTGVVSADIVNVVESSVVAGDQTVSATVNVSVAVPFYIEAGGQGGMPGCDATAASPAVLSYASLPAGVTVSPASLTFTSCGSASTNTQNFNFTSTSTGTFAIPEVTVTDGTGEYNETPSKFNLVVSRTVVDPCDAVSVPAAPVITSNPASPNGTNDWFTDVPTVSATSTTAGATISYATDAATFSATAPTLGEGTTTVTAKATSATCDKTSTSSRVFDVDTVDPVISGSDVNDTTWRNTDLSQTFTASDETSGLADSADSPFTLTASAESADASTPTTVSKTISDAAGNSSTRTLSAFIDKTKPVVSVTGVVAGAEYVLGSPIPTAGCSTSDALSGVETHATVGVTGGPVGSITATCTGAEDNAGNTSSASVTYRVIYNWTGFFQPVENPTYAGGQVTNFGWNKAKAGSSIPVKFNLGGDQGLNIFAAGFPRVSQVACNAAAASGDEVEETVTANTSGLKYDPVAGQYVYVWKTTTTYAGKCWRLDVKLIDDTTHSAYFNFTK